MRPLPPVPAVIALGAFAFLPRSIFGGLPPEMAFDELGRWAKEGHVTIPVAAAMCGMLVLAARGDGYERLRGQRSLVRLS